MFSVKVPFKRALLLSALVVCSASALQAAVKLPAIISDHMVLQRAQGVPVWGWANPGETVSVSLDSVSATTTADAKGNWKVELNLAQLGQGPYKMLVKGENEIEIKDVVIGQVWLASGQSNMQWSLNNTTGAKEEVAAGAGALVREFKVRLVTAEEPKKDVEGKWTVAEPGKTGGFSAVAYFFAKKLNQELKQPVGIINSSWGGTPSEAWTSAEAMAADKDLNASQMKRNAAIKNAPKDKKAFEDQLVQWVKKHNIADAVFAPAANFAGADVDTSNWTSVGFGTEIKGKDIPQRGVIWLRRDVNIPKAAAGKEVTYQIQQGRGYYSIYWNGDLIGGADTWTGDQLAKLKGQDSAIYYKIPGNLVKDGKNTVAIRIYSPLEAAGRRGWRNGIRGSGGLDANLSGGQWKAIAEKAFEVDATALAEAPKVYRAPDENRNQPARLFNAMIAPLAPYRLAGVIWYQGESNAGRSWQYRTAFPMMIEDWRKLWNEPELPFYFCQLANHMAKNDKPVESGWAELREAQSYALKLPKTGQAVLIDLGEANDIHPRNKQDVGDRLALLALTNDYGRSDVVAVGPTYEDKAVVGNKIYLKFKDEGKGSELVAHDLPKTYLLKSLDNTTAPLVALSPDSELQGFMICGADKKWVWAQAKIEGKHSVAVWSPEVPEPVAVRYAWANNPTCNLYNQAGLPAVPFRTDDFRASTFNARY